MVLCIIKRSQFWMSSLCLMLLLNPLSPHRGIARELGEGGVSSLRERIEFSVRWSFIPLIKTYMEIHRFKNGKDPVLYRLTHRTASNAFWNDHMASIIDSESLLPRRMETITREGKRPSVESIVFERDIGKALFLYKEPETGRGIVEALDITETSMDPLSAFYYLRKRLSPNRPSLEIEGTTGSYGFVLRGTMVGEEKIEVPAGGFKTYRMECNFQYWPQGRQATLKESKAGVKENGSFTLWVTQDDHRFPVQIRYRLPFGSLWVQATSLISYGSSS